MKTTIKLLLATFFLLSSLTSCKKSDNIIEAELELRPVSFMSAYGANDKEYSNAIKEIDSVLKYHPDSNVYSLYKYFNYIDSLGLFRNPYIFLEIKKDSVIPVYLSKKEYKKVKEFKWVDLANQNKKVKLKIELSKIEDSIYYSDHIIEVKKVNDNKK